MEQAAADHPGLRKVWVDGGYRKHFIGHAATLGIDLEIVQRNPGTKGFTPPRLLRPTDDSHDLVPTPGEQPLQPERDLTADADVRSRPGLDWTILRPGQLTDEPSSNLVTLAESTGRGDVTRDDVASVLVALLDEPRSAGRTPELIGGDAPVGKAVEAAVS